MIFRKAKRAKYDDGAESDVGNGKICSKKIT